MLLLLAGVYLSLLSSNSTEDAMLRSTCAFDQLVVGQAVSPGWSAALLRCLRKCARLYGDSFRAPVSQALLDELVLESQRAEACVFELIDQAPNTPDLLAALNTGRDSMVEQLRAWQTECGVRCGLASCRTVSGQTDVSG